jgi:RNA polymerase sigma factor (sigma-70 family)
MSVSDFFRTEYSKLVNYTRKYFSDSAAVDAEDIVQDVALNIFSKVDFESSIENAASYIYSAIRNRIIDIYRKPKRTIPIETDEEGNTKEVDDYHKEFTRESHLENEEYIEVMYQALGELPEEQRTIIIATELEDFSFKELSEKWNIPIGTLLSRKHRAMANLLNVMNEMI